MTTIHVNICVNSHKNGMPLYRLDGLSIDDFIQLEPIDRPLRCKRVGNNHLRIGKNIYRIYGYGTWVGNWCWDAVTVDVEVAQQILEYVRSTEHYNCFEAEISLFEAWDNGTPLVLPIEEDEV